MIEAGILALLDTVENRCTDGALSGSLTALDKVPRDKMDGGMPAGSSNPPEPKNEGKAEEARCSPATPPFLAPAILRGRADGTAGKCHLLSREHRRFGT